jgi:hypothetical protein
MVKDDRPAWTCELVGASGASRWLCIAVRGESWPRAQAREARWYWWTSLFYFLSSYFTLLGPGPGSTGGWASSSKEWGDGDISLEREKLFIFSGIEVLCCSDITKSIAPLHLGPK